MLQLILMRHGSLLAELFMGQSIGKLPYKSVKTFGIGVVYAHD